MPFILNVLTHFYFKSSHAIKNGSQSVRHHAVLFRPALWLGGYNITGKFTWHRRDAITGPTRSAKASKGAINFVASTIYADKNWHIKIL